MLLSHRSLALFVNSFFIGASDKTTPTHLSLAVDASGSVARAEIEESNLDMQRKMANPALKSTSSGLTSIIGHSDAREKPARILEESKLPEILLIVLFGEQDLTLVPHSISHIHGKLGVPLSHVHIVLHSTKNQTFPHVEDAVVDAGVPEGNVVRWHGKFTSQAKQRFLNSFMDDILQQRLLQSPDLWLGLWDADEFPVMQAPFQHSQPIDSIQKKLYRHAKIGYNVLGGVLVDRVADGGAFKNIGDESTNGDIFTQFPNECKLTSKWGWSTKIIAFQRSLWDELKISTRQGGHHLPYMMADTARCQPETELVEVAHFKWTVTLQHRLNGSLAYNQQVGEKMKKYLSANGQKVNVFADCGPLHPIKIEEKALMTCWMRNGLVRSTKRFLLSDYIYGNKTFRTLMVIYPIQTFLAIVVVALVACLMVTHVKAKVI